MKEYKFEFNGRDTTYNTTGETLYYRGIVNADYGQQTWANGGYAFFSNYSPLSVYNLIDGEPEYIFVRIMTNTGGVAWLGLDEDGTLKTVVPSSALADFSFYAPQ